MPIPLKLISTFINGTRPYAREIVIILATLITGTAAVGYFVRDYLSGHSAQTLASKEHITALQVDLKACLRAQLDCIKSRDALTAELKSERTHRQNLQDDLTKIKNHLRIP